MLQKSRNNKLHPQHSLKTILTRNKLTTDTLSISMKLKQKRQVSLKSLSTTMLEIIKAKLMKLVLMKRRIQIMKKLRRTTV